MFPLSRRSLFTILALMILLPGVCSLKFTEKLDNFRKYYHTKGSIPSNNKDRTISGADVSIAVNALMKSDDRSLIFLYGQDYEETVNNLTPFLRESHIQYMYLKNNGKVEHLGHLFSLVMKKHNLLLLDTTSNVISLFQKMRQKRLKTHSVKWVLLMEGSDADESIPRLEEFVNEGTQVTIFFKTSGGHLDLYLPSVDPNGVTRFKKENKRESSDNLKRTFSEGLQQPYNVSGRHFKVAVKAATFLITVGRTLPDGSVEVVSGVDIEILNLLSSALKFTYKTFLSQDSTWGDLMSDGNVTGIVGMVARREVTIAMSGLAITATRNAAVDFTSYYNLGRYLLMSRFPKPKTKSLAIFRPFKLQVWIFLISAVLLIGSYVCLVSYLVRKCLKYEMKKTDLQWFQFNVFRNVVNQSNEISDDSHPVRAVLSFWFLFCVILSALYSGMLTAVLAIPAYETPIDSLYDLPRATKEGFTVGTLRGSSYENLFKFAMEGVLKQTWELFNHEDRSKSFVVLKEKFVYITSDSHANAFKKIFGEKSFYLSRERLSPTYMGIACQVGSPVTRALTRGLIRLVEVGLVNKRFSVALNSLRADPSFKTEQMKNASFTLQHLQAAFFLYFLGMAVASLVLFAERFSSNYKKRNVL